MGFRVTVVLKRSVENFTSVISAGGAIVQNARTHVEHTIVGNMFCNILYLEMSGEKSILRKQAQAEREMSAENDGSAFWELSHVGVSIGTVIGDHIAEDSGNLVDIPKFNALNETDNFPRWR